MKFFLDNKKQKFSLILLLTIFLITSTYESTSSNIKKNKVEKQIFELNEDKIKSNNIRNNPNVRKNEIDKIKIPFAKRPVSRIYTYVDGDKPTSFFEKLKKMFSLYFQFFVIFSIISFHKWYEEMIKIRAHFVENRYSMFKDLTVNEKSISDYESEYVFVSGPTEIKVPARENVFTFPLKKDYAVIERKVEYFDVNKNRWERIGYVVYREGSISLTTEINNDISDVVIIKEDLMQLPLNGETFTFPRIISSMFLGQVEVKTIKISQQQLKNVNNYEKVKISSDSLLIDNCLEEFQQKIISNKEDNLKRIEYKISDDGYYIIIYPCDKEIINPKESNCKIRISFRGYKCEEVSIMAKLKNKCFKTLHIPYQYKEDDVSEHTSYINQSSSMVITPNFNFDICNILFCFCLSGPATYNQKDEIVNDPSSYIASINWISDKQMTKQEMIYEKHSISKKTMFFTRLFIFFLLVIAFFYIPETLIYIFKFLHFDPEVIRSNILTYDLIVSTMIIMTVYIFSLISYKLKHILNMFFFVTGIFVFIFYILKEVVLIA